MSRGRLLLLLVLLASGCGREEPAYSTRFLAFGTLVDLNIVGLERARASAAAAAIEADFDYMHNAWHAWDPGPLGRVNRLLETGERFAVPPSVLPLIRIGQELAHRSDHLFNPAVGRMVELWGFHADSPECEKAPAETEVAHLLAARPRMDDLELDGIMLRSRNPLVKLDFGAFGKGYGIDLAIAHLRELGVRNAILNAGGDLRAIGDRGGRPWRIAIRAADGGGVFGIVQVAGDESVFTSGDYERYCVQNGERRHHIIDPRTGRPAQGVHSVTVIDDDATTADAAATALFIAGPDDWYRIASQMGLRYVLLIDSGGTIHMNPAMAHRVERVDMRGEIRISAPLPGED